MAGVGACANVRAVDGEARRAEGSLAPIESGRPALIIAWGERPITITGGTLGTLLFAAYDDGRVIYSAPRGEYPDTSAVRYLTYQDNALAYQFAHNTNLRQLAWLDRDATPPGERSMGGSVESLCLPDGTGLRCFTLANPDRRHVGRQPAEVCRMDDQEERAWCYYLNGVHTAIPGPVSRLYRTFADRIEEPTGVASVWSPPRIRVLVGAMQCEGVAPASWPDRVPRPETGARVRSVDGATQQRLLDLSELEAINLRAAARSSGSSGCLRVGGETWSLQGASFRIPNAMHNWMWPL